MKRNAMKKKGKPKLQKAPNKISGPKRASAAAPKKLTGKMNKKGY